MGDVVGINVVAMVGDGVGPVVGRGVGFAIGMDVGSGVGNSVGEGVGLVVGGHFSVLPHEFVFSMHSALKFVSHSLHGRQSFGLLGSAEADKQPKPGQHSPWSPQTWKKHTHSETMTSFIHFTC